MSAEFIEKELRDLIKNADDDTLLLLKELAQDEIKYRIEHSESFLELLSQVK